MELKVSSLLCYLQSLVYKPIETFGAVAVCEEMEKKKVPAYGCISISLTSSKPPGYAKK